MRALAEQAERVIAITMYHGLATGWADLILPEGGDNRVALELLLGRLARTAFGI